MNKINLVDSHCHLNYPEFDNLDDTVAQAANNGVNYMQTICTQRADFKRLLEITEKYKNIFCSFGVHPHEAEKEGVTYEEIKENCQNPSVIGVGETGLDYFYNHAEACAQKRSFIMHLDAARELNLPVIIHTRDAEKDTQEILNQAIKKGSEKLLFHCFSSNAELARYGVEKDIYFSASGIITFKKSEALREIFKQIPLELLLVETDSPYLAPVPYRGKPNQPAYTRHVAEVLAEIKGLSVEEVARITTDNFFKLFNKAQR